MPRGGSKPFTSPLPGLLSVSDAADVTGKTPLQISNLMVNGRLPYTRMVGHRLVSLEDLCELVDVMDHQVEYCEGCDRPMTVKKLYAIPGEPHVYHCLTCMTKEAIQ